MNGVIEKYYHVSDGQVIQNECRRRVDKIFARYVPEKPGCREILHFFREHGYKIAMGSSSRITRIEGNLHQTGLRDAFDAIAGAMKSSMASPSRMYFFWRPAALVSIPGLLRLRGQPQWRSRRRQSGHENDHGSDLMPVTDDLIPIAYGFSRTSPKHRNFWRRKYKENQDSGMTSIASSALARTAVLLRCAES